MLKIVSVVVFQELEDQLHEEENKVNGLNKAKAKLERDLDEVCGGAKLHWIFCFVRSLVIEW